LTTDKKEHVKKRLMDILYMETERIFSESREEGLTVENMKKYETLAKVNKLLLVTPKTESEDEEFSDVPIETLLTELKSINESASENSI
jgi:hypothetical protein